MDFSIKTERKRRKKKGAGKFRPSGGSKISISNFSGFHRKRNPRKKNMEAKENNQKCEMRPFI